jgi:Ca2+-transporting ATPase
LLLAAASYQLHKQSLNDRYPRLATVPFSSERKYMATLHRYEGEQLAIIKGAAEIIVAQAEFYLQNGKVKALDATSRKRLIEHYEAMSRRGLRVLACAYRQGQHLDISVLKTEKSLSGYIFAGLVGLQDVLRPEAQATIQQALRSGIRTVIITGDNILTARSIARQLGLEINRSNIAEGKVLAQWSDQELKKRVKDIIVYARVTPADKLRIVRAWQARGEVVAMTGDGINDAPALKAAAIGVALGSGSEVAKETADLVLLDDNFQTIVTSVKEGRVIFDNIKKVILYLMAGSFSEVIVIVVALFLSPGQGVRLPLLAAQILWLNLVTDGFVQLALTVEPEEAEVMNRKPRGRLAALLGRESQVLIAAISLATGLGALVVFWLVWLTTGNIAIAQTSTFAALGTATLAYVFSLRNLRQPIWRHNIIANRYLNLAVAGSFALQLAAVYLPWLQQLLGTTALSAQVWWFISLYVIVIVMIVELIKMIFGFVKKYPGYDKKGN